MKKRYYILLVLLLVGLAYYWIDRQYFMQTRVLRHNLWEHSVGTKVMGDFIETKSFIFKGDTIIYTINQNKTDTLLLIYQYFDTMKLKHLRTRKTTKYEMKGRNWTNYL